MREGLPPSLFVPHRYGTRTVAIGAVGSTQTPTTKKNVYGVRKRERVWLYCSSLLARLGLGNACLRIREGNCGRKRTEKSNGDRNDPKGLWGTPAPRKGPERR